MTTRRNFLKATSHILMGSAVAHPPDWTPLLHSNETWDSISSEDFWETIRQSFPLSNHRAYFNCGTLGPSPQVVLDTVYNAMKEIDFMGEMAHTIDEFRQVVAQFVHVSPEEIAFTRNTTEGINIMAWGLPLKKGDEVILTNHEHVGNALPWLNRCKMTGIKIKVLALADTDEQILNNLKKLITHKTRAICIPHITCTTGRVLPIKDIVDLGHTKNIFVCIDGAHGAGMLNLNLKELGCDLYATCGHKWLLGSKGTGFLYVKKELQDILKSHFVGAGTNLGWDISLQKVHLNNPTPTAARYDYGTYNTAILEGMKAAIGFLDQIGMEKVEARVRELNRHLHLQLLEIDKKDLKLLTPTEGVSATSGMLGFQLVKKDTKAFAEKSNKKFRVRFVPESNLNSIRVSTHIFNSKIEIDGFVESLKLYLKT